MTPIQRRYVELNLSAPARDLSKKELEEHTRKAGQEMSRLSSGYGMSTYYIWAFADEVEKAEEIVRRIAVVPKEEWKIILQVHCDSKICRNYKERPEHAIKAERNKRLQYKINILPNPAVGDALQTLANELITTVVIKPPIVSNYRNDWEALLKTSLDVDRRKNEDDLTLQGLMELVAEQLNATTKLGKDFLHFRPAKGTGDQSAPNKEDRGIN